MISPAALYLSRHTLSKTLFYLESNPFCFYGQGSVCSLLISKEKEEVEAEDDRETRAKQFGMSPQNP